MTARRCVPARLWPLTLLALFLIPILVRAEPTGEADALDRKVLAEATAHSEILANLTYYSATRSAHGSPARPI